jgi:hypothetical protein
LIEDYRIVKSFKSQSGTAQLEVWARAPTLTSLQLSYASEGDIYLTPSLLSAQGYLAQKPVIKTARRETFCFATNSQSLGISRQAIDRLYQDFFDETAADTSKQPTDGRQAAKPWGDGAFLDFMLNSGTISRGRRSRGSPRFDVV